MIRQKFKIHDRNRFEVKVAYKPIEGSPKTIYDLECFFFLPGTLGINKDTYTRAHFFRDMQVYIRLKTPAYSLDSIAKEDSEVFTHLINSIEKLLKNNSLETRENYENQIKIFSCIFKSSLRDHVELIYSRNTQIDQKILLDKFIKSITAIAKRFRKLRQKISNASFPEKQFSIYLFADEFISQQIEQFTFKTHKILASRTYTQNSSLDLALELINSELEYRKKNNYPSIAQSDNPNEEFLFRSSVLKKFMGSILFLHIERQKDTQLVEHLLFALAAGISMIVATAIAFYSQIRLGNLTFPFFIALVVSYMFKDRVKELFKAFFQKQIRKLMFDQKHKIMYSPSQVIGECKENFNFCELDEIPEEITKIRNCDHITEIENGWVGQQVIRYTRRMEIFSGALQDTLLHCNLQSVNDILRFNISKFLANMDDPRKSIYCLVDGKPKRISSERVYHVNLVMRFTLPDKKQFYKRFRIVLNRSGIKRFEKIELAPNLAISS